MAMTNCEFSVYFIINHNGSHVKIGRSQFPVSRTTNGQLKARAMKLFGSSLMSVIASAPESHRTHEGDLHRRFRKYHLTGEWFVLSEEIKAFLDGNPGLLTCRCQQRIATLESALRPFVEFLEAFERKPINGLNPVEIYAIHGGDGVEGGISLRWEDLRAARSALMGSSEKVQIGETEKP